MIPGGLVNSSSPLVPLMIQRKPVSSTAERALRKLNDAKAPFLRMPWTNMVSGDVVG